MSKNRNMVYSNYQAGGFVDPNMYPNMYMNQPQGYNINTEYQAYGPNVMPGVVPQGYNNYENNYIDEYDQRISKLERQIKRIDQRLKKLESENIIDENITDSNLYMI